MTTQEIKQLSILACKVRMGIIESTHAAKCGHPGGSMSATEMFTYLYNKELNVTGILITMYNNRLILSAQVLSELRKHYADKLFETTVSRNVKLSEAPSFGAPVYYHEKRSKGAVEYLNIAKELAERI